MYGKVNLAIFTIKRGLIKSIRFESISLVRDNENGEVEFWTNTLPNYTGVDCLLLDVDD